MDRCCVLKALVFSLDGDPKWLMSTDGKTLGCRHDEGEKLLCLLVSSFIGASLIPRKIK